MLKKLITAYPDICTAYMMQAIMTVLARVATAERSFSGLKLIKNILRSLVFQKEWFDFAMSGKQTG